MAKTDWVDGNTVHGGDLNTLGAEVAAATAANAVNAAAVAGKQPLDADLTTIAGISPANDDVLQRKSGAWTNRTLAQLKTDLTLNNVNNTSDAGKPVSTAQQTALDLKANLASPTFTGTVSGVTKSHVGLGNVDNTADVDKPVSTATQTALTFMGYNVKDHGAVGDGSTNDRAALAAADTAAVAAGLPLLLPKGTYKVSSALTIASPVKYLPGAVIKPDSAVTVPTGYVDAPPSQQVFDHSAGGKVVPANGSYHPGWWGTLGTSDDSSVWSAMLDSVTAGLTTYNSVSIGKRIIAPSGVNKIGGITISYGQLVADHGSVVFTPPTTFTTGTMLTIGTYATMAGGRCVSSADGANSTDRVVLLHSKGGRTQTGTTLVVPKHQNITGVMGGDPLVGSSTPIFDTLLIDSGIDTTVSAAPAGTIGLDIQSPDFKANVVWIARTEQGMKGTRAGSTQIRTVHIWGCQKGITGNAWDQSELAGWVENCLLWGIDVDQVDHARWDFNIKANGTTYNGTTITDTGGARFSQTTGAARRSRINLILDDNQGKSLYLDGPDNYIVSVILSSSTFKSTGVLPKVTISGTPTVSVVTGVELTANCLQCWVEVDGVDATTPLTDAGVQTFVSARAKLRDNTTALTATRTVVWPDADINIVGSTNTQTLRLKRIDPRVTSTATGTSLTPSPATADVYRYTALTSGISINQPGGTPLDGNKIDYWFRDNGTARVIGFNTSFFKPLGTTLPTTTVVNKWTRVTTEYSAGDTFWYVTSVQQEA